MADSASSTLGIEEEDAVVAAAADSLTASVGRGSPVSMLVDGVEAGIIRHMTELLSPFRFGSCPSSHCSLGDITC